MGKLSLRYKLNNWYSRKEPQILLAGLESFVSVSENIVIGSTVGVLSVVNGTGTWTFTKTADPDSKFVLAGTGGSNLNTAAALNFETAQSHSVTIQATNGTETISRTFAIGVIGLPQAVGTLPDLLFNQNSGDQVVQTAQGFSGSGLTYSVQSFPTGADLSINSSTGALTIGTDTLVNSTEDGNVVIRATNGAGFAEQSFPLFVVVEQTFTILARQPNGTVNVESLAAVWAAQISARQPDGTFNLTEIA